MFFLKKLFKTMFIIALIALVVFCSYRFYKLKKEDKLKEVFARNENTVNEFYNDSQISSSSSNNNSSSQKIDEKKERLKKFGYSA